MTTVQTSLYETWIGNLVTENAQHPLQLCGTEFRWQNKQNHKSEYSQNLPRWTSRFFPVRNDVTVWLTFLSPLWLIKHRKKDGSRYEFPGCVLSVYTRYIQGAAGGKSVNSPSCCCGWVARYCCCCCSSWICCGVGCCCCCWFRNNCCNKNNSHLR